MHLSNCIQKVSCHQFFKKETRWYTNVRFLFQNKAKFLRVLDSIRGPLLFLEVRYMQWAKNGKIVKWKMCVWVDSYAITSKPKINFFWKISSLPWLLLRALSIRIFFKKRLFFSIFWGKHCGASPNCTFFRFQLTLRTKYTQI